MAVNVDNRNEDDLDDGAFERAERLRISKWAERNGGDIQLITELLESIKKQRAPLKPEKAKALDKMLGAFVNLAKGELPSDWLAIRLSTQTNYGTSGGTRTYSLTLDSDGRILADCSGSEWQAGSGSDTWSGAEYVNSPDGERSGYGFGELSLQFDEAVRDSEYELIVLIDDSSVGEDNEEEEAERIAGKKMARRIVQCAMRDLQRMRDPSVLQLGPGSGLRDVWDEICVQAQTVCLVPWEPYKMAIHGIIEGILDDCSRNQLRTIWLLTPKGTDWRFENPGNKSPAPCDADIIEFFYTDLLSKASDYENARIRGYCDRLGPTDTF